MDLKRPSAAPVLEYQVDRRKPRYNLPFWAQAVLGFFGYAVLVLAMDNPGFLALVLRVPYPSNTMKLAALVFIAATFCLHRRWNWGGFTLGVAAGAALTLLGLGLYVAYLIYA